MLSSWDKLVLKTLSLVEKYDSRTEPSGPRLEANSHVLAVGQTVAGRYRLEALLGEGGMGRVWLAEDTLEKRRVAFKEMKVIGASTDGSRGETTEDLAFKREFYTMTKLQHPNNVRVYDSGVLPSGDRYLTMEVVKGKDLTEMVARGPLELKQLYRVLIDLANVLGFIHSRLYVHSDIKSSNVRVTERGVVKLMDFGLMHQLGTPAGGSLKGTPAYMAPEIPKGGVIDGRTDLYALGVLAFELATGQYPFAGKTLTSIISQHLEAQPPSMQKLREVPPAFENIVLKLLQKDPKDRYQDSGELTRDLSALAGVSADVQDYSARTSYLHSAELVGRDPEQSRLKAALQAVEACQSRSLYLAAPAGVGKTRLVQEFRLSVKLADVPFFVGQCRAEGQAPLAPLVEALSQLLPLVSASTLQKHGPMLVSILPQIAGRGITPAPPPKPAMRKALEFEALRGLIRETATTQPFVLCMEDLHWADSTTIEFMNVVVRELANTRGMLLGTYRSNEVDRFSQLFAPINEGAASLIEIPPLSAENTAVLISTTLRGIQLPSDFVSKIFSSTQGNAFFVTETLRTLIEQQVLTVKAGRWQIGEVVDLPPTIEAAVQSRVATLTPETLALCRRIAPIGRVLDLNVVKRVAQSDETSLFAILDELVERQFLAKIENEYYFSHDTVRRGVYDSTPEDDRRASHERIGSVLETVYARDLGSHSATLGYHFARGRDGKKAARYLRQASDRALSLGILLEGTLLLAQTADVLEKNASPEPELLDIWARLVEIGVIAHPPSCAKYAEKLCPVLEKRVEAKQGFSRFNAENRRLLERQGWLAKRKLKRIWSEQPFNPRSAEPLHLVPKLSNYQTAQALSFGVIGNGPKAGEILKAVVAHHPDPGPFKAAAQVSSQVGLYHMGQWSTLLTQSAEAKRWFDEHLERVGVLPNRLMWNYTGVFYWPNLARAAMGLPLDTELLSRGVEVAEQYGFADWQYFLRLPACVSAFVAGGPDAMQSSYGPLSDTLRKLGSPPLMETRLYFFLPSYYLQRSELQLAIAATQKMEDLAATFKDAWMRRYALAYRAQIALVHEPKAKWQPAVDAAMAAAREVPNFSRMTQLLCLQAKSHLPADKPLARQVADEAVTRATTPPTANPWDECIALRTRAEVLEGPEAVTAAEAAVEAARRHQLPLQEALAQFTLAQCSEASDRTRSAHALNAAEDLLTRLKCTELLATTSAWRRKVGRVR